MLTTVAVILGLAIIALVAWPFVLMMALFALCVYVFTGWAFVIAAIICGKITLGLVLLIIWLIVLFGCEK